MAKTGPIDLPPSLAEGFAAVIRSAPGGGPSERYLSTQPAVRQLQGLQYDRDPGVAIMAAARWLSAAFFDPADRYSNSSFLCAELGRLRAGTLDGQYWAEATQLADNTAYAVPEIATFTGVLDPFYADPLRQPTQSLWDPPSASYATPAFPTSPPNPSPGFSAGVIAGFFQDLYLSQQVLTLALPFPIDPASPRPALLHLAGTINAQATRKPNRAWLTIQHRLEYHDQAHPPTMDRMITWYDHRHLYAGPCPGENNAGWSHSITLGELRGPGRAIHDPTVTPCDRATLTLAVPPTQGRYSSNNDAVSVQFHTTPTLWIARHPND